MQKHIPRISIVLITVLTILLSACAPAATSTAEEGPTQVDAAPTEAPAPDVEEPEPEPVVLRVGALLDVDCWNWYMCIAPWFLGYLVEEGLTDHGPASEGCAARPRLAKTWEVSEDGKTWTIELHEGITFSDGVPVTAETFKTFIEWFSASPDMAAYFAESLYLESVEVIDDLHFRYTTSEPVINSPDATWQWWYLLPPHIWTELDPAEVWTYPDFPPVGTGPYTVTEYEPSSYVILDARPDYYLGKPPIDRIVYTIYTNDEAIVSALLAGEIDATTPWMPPESYDVIVADPNITVEEKAPYAGVVHWLVFNVYEYGNKHPAIDDSKVREAIDYAIDKQQIVDVALLGHGTTCPTGWTCVSKKELNPELVVTPYDPAKANQILDEGGYVDTDGDGIRETPDGLPMELRLLIQVESAPAVTISQMLSDWLGQIGIEVLLESQETGTWGSVVLEERDFDMTIDSEAHDITPVMSDTWFSCWSAEAGINGINYPGYCNPEMDELVYEYWLSTDLEARWTPMYKAQRMLNQDRPFITLAGQNSIQAYRNDRFEFPFDTCDVGLGMLDPQGLLNATVK